MPAALFPFYFKVLTGGMALFTAPILEFYEIGLFDTSDGGYDPWANFAVLKLLAPLLAGSVTSSLFLGFRFILL